MRRNRLDFFAAIFCFVGLTFAGDSITYEAKIKWQGYATNQNITAMAVQNGKLYHASTIGITVTDLKNNDKTVINQLGELPIGSVAHIAVDPNGTFWAATPEGLACKSFAGIITYTTKNGLPDNDVRSVCVGPDRHVWVATANGVAVKTADSFKVYTTDNGLLSNDARTIVIDKQNTVWIGTVKGVSAFNGTTWTNHTMNTGLSWNNIKVLALDRRNGSIWAAVGDQDINAWTGKEWQTYISVSAEITDIMVDTQGRIWVSSAKDGLIKYNGEEWLTDPNKVGLAVAKPTCLVCDEKGNLWFGTEKGIMKMDNPYPY